MISNRICPYEYVCMSDIVLFYDCPRYSKGIMDVSFCFTTRVAGLCNGCLATLGIKIYVHRRSEGCASSFSSHLYNIIAPALKWYCSFDWSRSQYLLVRSSQGLVELKPLLLMTLFGITVCSESCDILTNPVVLRE